MMSDSNTIEQIGRQSNKVLFQYSLSQQRFEYLSKAFYDIWTLDKHEVEKEPLRLLDTVEEEDRPAVLRCWHKLLKGDQVEETISVKQGKRQRFVHYDVYPIQDKNGTVVALAGMAEDVTKQREFLDYLAEFGQRKNSVLEMVSHDLRGPLAVVKSVAGLLRKDWQDQRHEDINTYTDIIEKACVSCTDLINDLLNEEHLRSTETYVNKTRVDLNEQIRNVAEFYRKGKVVKQSIVLDLPDEPLVMPLDQIKFSQVLNNLISNSIKFTPPQGHISIRAYLEGEEVVVEHQDDGIGIPAHMQAGLFERHKNVGRRGLNGEESRGLGLSIVYDLVKLQGGRISVHSKEHEGTSFTIRLPLLE
ncbi:PAS domain-containing sensor histidine kinase [uncultured Pontibacter sp.]|uniref:PAS domain-containing sensor histidine kinase n=1 Tax=uncultured Pontibacter sp. TaxID=453356 RepID=UPI002629F13F|nr:PAS domain-containing sensor histidine kinase [uncultured Pontibacter sp.]